FLPDDFRDSAGLSARRFSTGRNSVLDEVDAQREHDYGLRFDGWSELESNWCAVHYDGDERLYRPGFQQRFEHNPCERELRQRLVKYDDRVRAANFQPFGHDWRNRQPSSDLWDRLRKF